MRISWRLSGPRPRTLRFRGGIHGGCRPSSAACRWAVGCMRGFGHTLRGDSLLDGKIGKNEDLALQVESSALAARQ